jgi:hypothetical protein
MPCNPADSIQWIIASAQTAQGCEINRDGVRFFVATIDHKRISYISTEDGNFVSPEGIHVGNSRDDVLKAKGTEMIAELGWAYYSKLPSGWCVRYAGMPGVDSLGGQTLHRDSTVVGFFMKQ